ncbi:MAG: AAA-like domain-containing protein [bacterium]
MKKTHSRIFISYRHREPDEKLARFIAKSLGDRGHHIFIDIRMPVGTNWVNRIEDEIKAANFFIVLLSGESIRSEMVRQEVKLAHRFYKEKGLQILPVRVAFRGELPYDLGAYLDTIQYAVWEEPTPYDILGQQIIDAVERSMPLNTKGKPDDGESSDSGVQGLFDVTEAIGAPLPKADHRLAPLQIKLEKGTLRPNSPFYIKRKADDEIQHQIRAQGTTTVVKGPRQMGKSSLLARVHAEARQNEQQSCYLDFQLIDASHLSSLETIFRYLAKKIGRDLKVSADSEAFWRKTEGAKDNITNFMEGAILSQTKSPIIILIDEADQVFNMPWRDDFFSTIRGWHNLRATRDTWDLLNLVIAHSTEPYLWIRDIHQSPFNVAFPIRLEDFHPRQVSDLNERHGSPLKGNKGVEGLMGLVGGQPYLVRQALYTLVTNQWSLPQLQEVATSERGPFGDHLRSFVRCLQENRPLKKALQQVLYHGSCDDEECFQRLWSAGLVKGETRHEVWMRCNLYLEYFKTHL